MSCSCPYHLYDHPTEEPVLTYLDRLIEDGEKYIQRYEEAMPTAYTPLAIDGLKERITFYRGQLSGLRHARLFLLHGDI